MNQKFASDTSNFESFGQLRSYQNYIQKKEFSTLRYDYEFFLIYFQNVADDSHAGPSEEEHVGENDEENDEEPPGNLPPEEAVTSKFNHAHHVR